MTHGQRRDSLLSLNVDLLSAKVLVWMASVGRDAELTPQAHLYFFDRYRRLAECHRAQGRLTRSRQLLDKADEHFRAGGGGQEPPRAAAMAMPRPSRFVVTNAVSRGGSRGGFDGPDAA